MVTLAALLTFVCCSLQESSQGPAFLAVGGAIAGEVTDADPVVHTPTLDTYDGGRPVRGTTYRIEVEETGPRTIELRSFFFDAYVVVRDEAGSVLGEDDDGLLSTHSRLVIQLEGSRSYTVDACALHGDRGAFELRVVNGQTPDLTPGERKEGERQDALRRVEFLEREKPGSLVLAAALSEAAARFGELEDQERSLRFLEQALSIKEGILGPDHPDTALCMHGLGHVFERRGDYAEARSLFELALATLEEHDHKDVARVLADLGGVLHQQKDYVTARPILERALAMSERDPGTRLGASRLLGYLMLDLGDPAAARPYFERARELAAELFGPEHVTVARALNDLAALRTAEGDAAGARALYERALSIEEKQRGPESPEAATILFNMFGLEESLDRRRAMLERVLSIYENTLGPDHPDTASCLNALSLVLWREGELSGARRMNERALAISEQVLGADHPDTALYQINSGVLLAASGEPVEAFRMARAAVLSSLRHARSNIWSLSERERLELLRAGDKYLRLCLSAPAWTGSESIEGEVYELLLAWRGLASRSLLASSQKMQALVDGRAKAVLAELRRVQSSLSGRLYAGDARDLSVREVKIPALVARRNQLEVELLQLAGPSTERSVGLAELGRSLGPGAAFLDLLVHPSLSLAGLDRELVAGVGGWSGEDRVSAWIVRPERNLVRIDLGPAAAIEEEVKRWLGHMVGSRGVASEEQGGGKELRDLLWTPLASALEGATRIFVRPDSFLGTLPFEVIPLDGRRFLIEEKDFVYVQTPLDLVERPRLEEAPRSLLAVGGVDFQRRSEEAPPPGAAAVMASAAQGSELRGNMKRFWSRLPQTENEAQTVSDLFEAAFQGGERLMLSADAATEERLKQDLPRHSIVHLATHGFFHPEGTVSMWDSAREAASGDELLGAEHEARFLAGQLPGLLCGLVCAGANLPVPEGRDDGLLTAEEVLWLDLSKVDLVVLSACETALGERRSGEGMIGLRRAFGLAGARTVVSSLWSVKDRSTSELMQRFYENLWLKKQARADALRNAQLEMLARNRVTEGDALPSTWGAFVLSGEWR